MGSERTMRLPAQSLGRVVGVAVFRIVKMILTRPLHLRVELHHGPSMIVAHASEDAKGVPIGSTLSQNTRARPAVNTDNTLRRMSLLGDSSRC